MLHISTENLEMKPVRLREHLIFNLLNFFYFRRANVRFLMENGPFASLFIVPYVLFSEAYFLRQWRFFILFRRRVTGVLALVDDAAALYVSSIAVSPDYRRLGVATYALSKVEAIARKLDKEAVELAVLKNNIPAIRLYQILGYRMKEEKRRSLILRKQIRKLYEDS